MWTGEIVAYMLSTTIRRDVRRETIANLAATDWDAEPVVILDQERYDDLKLRMSDNGRSLLLRAISGPGDVFLFLEDDLAFNRSLRWNLERWPPLLERPLGADFYASLYNPNVGSLSEDMDGETYRIVDPENVYGSQAVVMSVSMAALILRDWNDVRGLPDIKMSRLAARRTPIYYHLPSLVDHRQAPSLWGGVAHAASDYSPDWRAV
ncbi:MAG: hypothetical protein QOD92_4194 [Acidimicrobiaceae bacterium]|jgi:hypothetical protein